MSGTIERYLDAKYSAGGPGSSRFDPVDGEVHASQVSDCQRKRKWKHERGTRSDPSPYFELGRVFEVLYGAALAFKHDPDVTEDTLKSHPPWEVVELSTAVVQDVNVEIAIGGGASIVGEADWAVLKPRALQHAREAGGPDAFEVHEPGDRTVVWDDGTEHELAGGDGATPVEKVVETKTKKDLDWVRRKGPDEKHVYQVYPYMHAFDAPGEIAYMQRNDWEELVVPLEYDEDRWLDSLVRAKAHARNQSGAADGVPPTTPLNEDECRWCDFSHECQQVGGSRWE
jgi:hypothetical protein